VVVLWEQQPDELDILMDLLVVEEQQTHNQIHQEEMELLIQEAEVEGVRIQAVEPAKEEMEVLVLL
jgi:hypothetical protein